LPGVLALDVGEKRIGVAVSEWADIVTPLGMVPRGPNELEAIQKHVEERLIDKIVVGLPISLDDTIGTQAKKVLAFIERLKAAVRVPIETFDERFSTHEAEALLLEADVSRAKRRQSIDELAAAQILQGYLRAQKEGSMQDRSPVSENEG
jgi:putative Holliday junction resolvase